MEQLNQPLYEEIITQLTQHGAMTPEALNNAVGHPPDMDDALEHLIREALVIPTKKGRYMLPSGMGLLGGRLIGNARGFGFFQPATGEKDLFIAPDDLHGALHNDKVLVRMRKVRKGDRPAAEVSQIVHRANESIMGTFSATPAGGLVRPDDPRIGCLFQTRGKSAVAGAVEGDRVAMQVTRWSSGKELHQGRITQIISSADAVDAEIRVIIHQRGLQEQFSAPALEAAEALPDRVIPADLPGREDFRAQNCFTIDGADARDFDDAVAIERLENKNYRLYVHIADVGHYVPQLGALDLDAYDRGTSVYLIDRVLPMLPKSLSNGICSLNPLEDRLTLTCVMEIDAKTGNVVDSRIVNGVICSKARLIYEEVNALLEDKDPAMRTKMKEQAADLKLMAQLQRKLYARRIKRGSIEFEIPEADITLDEMGKPTDIKAAQRGTANRMIEEFMLLANETVAQYAIALELPFLFRVHETPDSEKITDYARFAASLGYRLRADKKAVQPKDLQKLLEQAKETPEEGVLSKLMLRSMQRARYAPQNLGHFGLALQDYCHFTSPIRRYPDLFIHRVLKTHLAGDLDAAATEKLTVRAEGAATQSSERERNAAEAERDVDSLLKAEYMTGYVGEEFDGIIDGVSDYGIFVELPNTVSGMVSVRQMKGYFTYAEELHALIGPNNVRYRMGDSIRVRCTGAFPDTRKIDFEIVAPTDSDQ